ncbi:hypothetical protein M9H77_21037 [Catharanthus roseus]|uniref:Uncharacterized protein n=1 Tax=Catharanthus roseus TaxID=4058 RepID=A0ACC0AMA8_CATRO|nr:hypothetical protein M9H77_21037 [Catharanthus roseus]
MDAFIEETETIEMENKSEGFDDEGQASKLLIIYTISKDHSREQFGCGKDQVGPALTITGRFLDGQGFECHTLQRRFSIGVLNLQNPQYRLFIKGGDLGKVLNQIYNKLKIHIKVVSERTPNEGQFVLAIDLELEIVIMIHLVNEENYVNMDERFQKRKGDYEGHYDRYNYGGYNYRRSSQTLGTTSRPLSYNNLKLPLLCGTFGPCDYEVWEQKSSMGEESPKVLNVLIMCGWKNNREEYVRYHEGCSHDAHNQGGTAYGGINHSGNNFTPRKQDSVVLPTLYGKFVPTYYLEWESEVKYLLDAYNVDEDDKAILASCAFTPSFLEYILAYSRRKGVGFNTWSELKGALSNKFGADQFERLEWSQEFETLKGSKKSQGTVELLQGPVTRAMARRMEEEHQGKIIRFKKMIQALTWKVIGDQEEDLRGLKLSYGLVYKCRNLRKKTREVWELQKSKE